MPWKVLDRDVQYFLRELSKDQRDFPRAKQRDEFAKNCFEPRLAQIEAYVLSVLLRRIGPGSVPVPIRIEEDSILIQSRVVGARLYDLIRHLQSLEEGETDSAAKSVRKLLINRARSRLRLVQIELLQLAPEIGCIPYPLEEKLRSLLEFFIRILDIKNPPSRWTASVAEFVKFWEGECAEIPFRDATTKNMIIADSRLAPTDRDDRDGAQREAVKALLQEPNLDFWHEVPICDIDFSSVIHLTSIEDDPISLHCHQWTYGSRQTRPEDFVLDPSLGVPSPERTAASFLVRYLRFGGRKLAYFLVNTQGFKVRFAYDDPLFYFRILPEICEDLSPQFSKKFADLIHVTELIYKAAKNPSRGDLSILEIDHVRRYREPFPFWQQTPLELE